MRNFRFVIELYMNYEEYTDFITINLVVILDYTIIIQREK